jgi:cytochrome o ubiquinol oxidase operon protein cyoD
MSHDSHAHGSVRSYVAGFILSVVLTLASFGAVMSAVLPGRVRLPMIVVLCVAQLFVQLVYFLHLGSARSQRANTAIFACTTFLIAIVVAGSLWVMHNANINMMPMPMSVHQAMMHE